MKKLTSRIYITIIYIFLYAPIVVLIVFSFNESKSRSNFTGFTLKWYKELVSNELILNSFRNTIIVAVVASILATVIGTIASLGISNMNKRSKGVVMNVTYLPVINPEIVTGISLMLLFVYISQFLGIELGFWSVTIAHITFSLPYVILNVLPKLRQMDIRLYEAAMDLGCSPNRAFYKVVVPEILPGIMSGFLMAFTFSIDDFIITYFTSGSAFQTLPVTIYSMMRRKVNPQVNALSAIIFMVVLVLLLLSHQNDLRKAKR